MISIEALRDELASVANVISEHKEVAEATKNSVSFVAQIRNGTNAKANTEKNQQLLQGLIDSYRKIGRRKNHEIEKVFQMSDYITENRKILWEFVHKMGFDINYELYEKGIEDFLKDKIQELEKTDIKFNSCIAKEKSESVSVL